MRRTAVIAGLFLSVSAIAASAQDYDRSNQASGSSQTYGQAYNDQADQAQRDRYNANGQYDQNQQRYYGGQSAQNSPYNDQYSGSQYRDRDAGRYNDPYRDSDRDNDDAQAGGRSAYAYDGRDHQEANDRDGDRDEAEATVEDRDNDRDAMASRAPTDLQRHGQAGTEAAPTAGDDFYDRDQARHEGRDQNTAVTPDPDYNSYPR